MIEALIIGAPLLAIYGLIRCIAEFGKYEQGRARRAHQFAQDAWVLGVRNRKINPTPKPTPEYQAERASEAVQAVLRG